MSDILGGIFKGLSGFMPQDDPEVRLYQAQAELNEMQPAKRRSTQMPESL